MDFKTSDTPLAAYLVTQGHLPSVIDYSSPPRYEIVFANSSEDIRNVAAHYNAGLAKVEPIAFNRILRKFNRILRNQIQWEDD
uniref:DUF5659 domain-containing protein n=1 Tax=viral metagenome TaxID=1070528 RepID=A0A6M3IT79_9ZZZZ